MHHPSGYYGNQMETRNFVLNEPSGPLLTEHLSKGQNDPNNFSFLFYYYYLFIYFFWGGGGGWPLTKLVKF